jgi:hypothetical protein
MEVPKKMTEKQSIINENTEEKELPIGISSFPKIVEKNLIYVDKTEYVYRLLKRGGIYFLSRPRRFGKSLLISILKEIFNGKKELFKGYWIYDRIQWQKYPVIHLDFLDIDYRTLGLEKALSNQLDRIAKQYGLKSEGDSCKEKFGNLIRRLSTEKRVAVLIDEYDKPIIDYLEKHKLEIAAENRDSLRNFYSVLKSQDNNIEFLFITGISRFSKVSVFSELNHLNDITFHPDYMKMLGFSREEIEAHFSSYIDRWIKKTGGTADGLLKRLQDEYNGYSWDGSNFVYNPHSIHKFFDELNFGNYWFETGTPGFLVKVAMEKDLNIEDWDNLQVRRSFFSQFDIENMNPGLLLFQSGYLTIKKFDGERYTLSYPNREVQSSFFHFLLEKYSDKSHGDVEKILPGIKKALKDKDIDSFVEAIRVLFSGIPYNISLSRYEAYYHSLIYIVLKMSGIDILPEKETNIGRIDAAVETEKYIYIMEFKMGSADEAIKQVFEKKYYEPFRLKKKEIILLGIGFSREERNIFGFKHLAFAAGEKISAAGGGDRIRTDE